MLLAFFSVSSTRRKSFIWRSKFNHSGFGQSALRFDEARVDLQPAMLGM